MQHSSFTPEQIPKHIAVIMDGNGRWAKAQGKPRVFGHRNGVKAVRSTIMSAAKFGVQVITLFAFSQENWSRPKDEVGMLMELFLTALSSEVKKLHKNNLRFRVMGDTSQFSPKLQQKITESESLTANNTGMIVNIAANYGGKWDLIQAAKHIATQVELGLIRPSDVTEALLSQHLSMSDLPDVDLLIRTSGESRISNFMLWQIAYAELYFTPVYWPDFDEACFQDAIKWYVNRERRFGFTGEQLDVLQNK